MVCGAALRGRENGHPSLSRGAWGSLSRERGVRAWCLTAGFPEWLLQVGEGKAWAERAAGAVALDCGQHSRVREGRSPRWEAGGPESARV